MFYSISSIHYDKTIVHLAARLMELVMDEVCAVVFEVGSIFTANRSVLARFGKGQGAKEIGHNLARERPKFEHGLEREQPSRGTLLRPNGKNSGTIQHANETRSEHNFVGDR